ncbi:MAG: TetR/AcrR family transcriptional regulator [Candidatus Calescibacterium sp.]|nr:TetR/AcrR family transcriptional regulator [Candidatus Calescibacterium sp.]MDW8087171.1 TetR/AcrR family transcriptional regulator [Candidatus Calescibacterium sp.]
MRMPEETNRRYRKNRIPEILNVAARLFREKGFSATSIQDIAQEIGIEKGAIYYWIKSKDDILYQLIENEGERFIQNVSKIIDEEISPDKKLEKFMKKHIDVLTENVDKASVFFNEHRSLPKKWKSKIIQFRDKYESILRKIIEEGQKEGKIRKDIDAKIIGFAILGMINWVFHWFSKSGRYSSSEIGDAFWEIIYSGIKKQD